MLFRIDLKLSVASRSFQEKFVQSVPYGLKIQSVGPWLQRPSKAACRGMCATRSEPILRRREARFGSGAMMRFMLQLMSGVQDSGGLSIVIVEHATQPFVAPHPTAGTTMAFIRMINRFPRPWWFRSP
jgi:hypothetical protein